MPRPIGEINSEIPDWLAAIIDRLLAKDASERFESAAEVAELLGGHLAHLQQPDVVPRPATLAAPAPKPRPEAAGRSRRRLAAAACLLVALGAFAMWYFRNGSSPEIPGNYSFVDLSSAANHQLSGLHPEPGIRTHGGIPFQIGDSCIRLSPDGKMLLSVTGPWTTGPATSVCLWDAATHALLARFATHQPGTMAATFSPDGKILATTGRDGRVHLWDVAEVLEKAAVD